MKANVKIAGILFLVLLSLVVVYIAINTEDRQSFRVESIEISGGKYIANTDYASFAKLADKNDFKFLTLGIIKDRIESHPYVEKADVKFDGLTKVEVVIKERNFDALLMDSDKQLLVTDKMQLIPYMPNTINLDLHVISNAGKDAKFINFSDQKNNYNLKTAFKIMGAFKFIDEDLYSGLSQIDMRDGKDILVYFSSMQFPIIFGRGNEITKAVYFDNIWKLMKGKELNGMLDYVDLRFEKHVFLGVTDSNSGNEEKHI